MRSEFWWFVLFNFAASAVLSLVYQPLSMIFGLATFLSYLAVISRRLHDINRSGWWMLLPLIAVPFGVFAYWTGNSALMGLTGAVSLGAFILLIVWYCKKVDAAANRFGPPPAPAVEEAAQTA